MRGALPPNTKTAAIRAFLETVDFGKTDAVTHEEVRELAARYEVSEGYAEHVVRGFGLGIGSGRRKGPPARGAAR